MNVDSITALLKACGLESELSLPPAVTLQSLDAALEESRPKALTFLKDKGVEKLGHRQKLVNEFSKAKREERLNLNGSETTAPPAASPASAGSAAIDVSDATAPIGPAKPQPRVGQYRWLVDISGWEPGPAEWTLLLMQLPEEESTKVMKFRFVADQKRALVSRFLQRRACFEATGVAWKAVEITRTKGGKPFMKNKPAPPKTAGLSANWNFNVSHEGKFVALAAESRMVCGVDVSAPEESRGGKKRDVNEQLNLMKGRTSCA